MSWRSRLHFAACVRAVFIGLGRYTMYRDESSFLTTTGAPSATLSKGLLGRSVQGRHQPSGPYWLRSAVMGLLVLGLHIVVIIGILAAPPLRTVLPVSLPAYIAVNLSTTRSSPARVSRATPIEPQPSKARQRQKPQLPLEPLPLNPQPTSVAQTAVVAESSIAPEQDSKPSEQVLSSLDSPSDAVPKTGAASVEQTWENLVLAALNRHKRYPQDAQARGLEDVVYLRFNVDRQGAIADPIIERSRGIASLDAEALALPRRASPLPPPPPQILGDPIELLVPIEFFLSHSK